MVMLLSKRLDVVGLDTDSFTTLSEVSFFWFSLPFTDICEAESDFDFVVDDEPATDVLVTVALEVAFVVDCDVDEDDGALL